MMFPGCGGMGGGGWVTGLSMLLFAVLLGFVAWLVLRFAGKSTADGGRTAQAILAKRYARSEIDEQEYQHRSRILNGSRRGSCRRWVIRWNLAGRAWGQGA